MHSECEFIGPLLTQEFALNALPALLTRRGLYPAEPHAGWRTLRQGSQEFAGTGGPVRVLHHVVQPLAAVLGYGEIRREAAVSTREGLEDGGYLLHAASGPPLRAWVYRSDTDLDTPLPRNSAAARVIPSALNIDTCPLSHSD